MESSIRSPAGRIGWVVDDVQIMYMRNISNNESRPRQNLKLFVDNKPHKKYNGNEREEWDAVQSPKQVGPASLDCNSYTVRPSCTSKKGLSRAIRPSSTVKTKAQAVVRTSWSANSQLPLSLRTELMEWDGMKDSCPAKGGYDDES